MATLLDTESAVAPDLRHLGNVPATYRHQQRRLAPGPLLVTPRAVLKWYALHPVDLPIMDADQQAAREYARAALTEAAVGHGLGFVIHHASTALAYLVVGVWYQTQELWLTVAVRERAGAPFAKRQPGVDWSTACVWELAPIWHEREAWVRYLRSPRDAAAKAAYLADHAQGPV